jgi:hypothetical protein
VKAVSRAVSVAHEVLRFPGRLICQPVRAGARVSGDPSEAFLHFAASIANRTFHTVLIKMILRLRLQEEPDGVKKVPRALFEPVFDTSSYSPA